MTYNVYTIFYVCAIIALIQSGTFIATVKYKNFLWVYVSPIMHHHKNGWSLLPTK